MSCQRPVNIPLRADVEPLKDKPILHLASTERCIRSRQIR